MRLLILLALFFFPAVALADDECPLGFEMVDGQCEPTSVEEPEEVNVIETKVVSTSTEREVIQVDEDTTVIISNTTTESITVAPYKVIGIYQSPIDRQCQWLKSNGYDADRVTKVRRPTRVAIYELRYFDEPQSDSLGAQWKVCGAALTEGHVTIDNLVRRIDSIEGRVASVEERLLALEELLDWLMKGPSE